MAPPQGFMRPARSSSKTLRPRRTKSSAAVAPDGPPPTTITSYVCIAISLYLAGTIGPKPPVLLIFGRLMRAASMAEAMNNAASMTKTTA